MRVHYVLPEIFSLAKTGGLADASAALPLALTTLGREVRVLLPGYPWATGAGSYGGLSLAGAIDLAQPCAVHICPAILIGHMLDSPDSAPAKCLQLLASPTGFEPMLPP
jgi:hypothetical protein